MQFYFLSVLCNAAAGYSLISDRKQNDAFRLAIGILTIVSGVFKLLSAIQGDVPVLGDIIPAIIGFAAGSVLVLEYYRKTSTLEPSMPSLLELFLNNYKKQIGFLAITAAVLHFLFPQVLLI